MDAPSSNFPHRTAFASIFCALFCGALLSGCVETTASVPPPVAEPHHAMLRRDGVSPGGASIAVTSLSGVPKPLADRFVSALKQQAQAQDVTFTDPAKAKYLLRGYLSAYPTAEGSEEVAFVWDAFDTKKNRAQRGDNMVAIKADAADPWSAVDDTALADIAAQSASDLAAFLSNTPEALLAARESSSKVRSAAAAPAPAATEASGETVVPGAAPPLRGTSSVGVAALR